MIYTISIITFTVIILLLVLVLALIENAIVNKEDCEVLINDDKSKSPVVPSGTNLLTALSNEGIFIPSACGGGGSCGMCKVEIHEGGGDFLPTELPHLTRQERKDQVRLSCQLKVKNNLKIQIPDEIFSIKKFECEVVSNHNVATFIKELKLKMPEDMDLDFRAGGYIQIDIPPYKLSYNEFEVEEEFRPDWDQFKLWEVNAENDDEVFRAYSMANYPEEKGTVLLNVRIASPPPGSDNIPAGIGSSYIFNLKPGDKVIISGPYGEFYAKETQREMCFVGGGAGMAPMRSHIFDQLKRLNSNRKMTFWYGARSFREMFYDDEFQDLQNENDNFKYHVALSEPLPEDNWTGYTGFIHQVLHDNYLKDHEDPTEIEYYLCGPPMMLSAMQKMLYDIGVEPEMIAYDDFG
tara:strand:- start:1879 stop:3099 length:1221 start_codon:yes stop_codon:yes gene_type:complete